MYKYNPSLPIQYLQYDYEFCYGEQVTVIDTDEIGYVYDYNYYMHGVVYNIQFLVRKYPRWMFWKDDELKYKGYQAKDLGIKTLIGTLTINGTIQYI